MMMTAISFLGRGKVGDAILEVSKAFEHFEKPTVDDDNVEMCYLPGLMFLYSLTILTNDHAALHTHIPAKCLRKHQHGEGHSSTVNSISWAPHSSGHICTGGEDKQALIWDLGNLPKPVDFPILQYEAEAEISQLQWSSLQTDWIGGNGDEELCYLPGFLFLRIPANLSSSFSRALSYSPSEMRGYCKGVLATLGTVSEEWGAIATGGAALSQTGNDIGVESQAHLQQPESWAHKLYVALWTTFCLDGASCEPLWLELSTYCQNHDVESGSAAQVPQLLSSSSLGILAVCYISSIGGLDRDVNRAVSLLRSSVNTGNSWTTNSLGLAADAGNAKAMFNLAVCYQNGHGVDKDLNQAAMFYRKAAELGHSTAMHQLSVCYDQGCGVDKDSTKALSLVMRAANDGHP
ncbi:hypothetical protein Pelo_1781 [Pelomyxa schiedti]|nr:hypothetical protein Pelo_1781 [Pelomyxa schiedti]